MIAFHGSQELKDKFLARVRKHREADELVQGTGWDGHRGCAIGCTLENYDHYQYEIELGIPIRLARIQDAIFDGLPKHDALLWPERFLSAVSPGADLSYVWHDFEAWKLSEESGLLTINDLNRDAIAKVRALHMNREPLGSVAWSAAESAAWLAWSARPAAWFAWLARSAAWSLWSAAWSSRSARSAWSAADSDVWLAESAAESAADSAAVLAWSAAWLAWSAAVSAWSAAWGRSARSAAYHKMADKLIELIRGVR